MADTMTCGVNSPDPARRRAVTAALDKPKSAALSASVAPLVRMISSGREAPSAAAIFLRAPSSAAKAARPGKCRLFAFAPTTRFARPLTWYGAIASAASSHSGAVAA